MGKLIDLTGQRFGKLTVIERAGTKNKHVTWRCICDCGKETIVKGNSLTSGLTRSCGCLYRAINQAGAHTTHGGSADRLYNIWRAMRQRCQNPNSTKFADYGGRGIRVCGEWQSYPAFRDWALSHGYADDLSIDRIDFNGNYEPNNCRWATVKVQNNNRRPRKRKVDT